MSVLTATILISTHGAIWNYPGCWHEMYPHIHMSTLPTCWPNVKLMFCSVTLGHQMPLPGSIGGMSDDRPVWSTSWLYGKLTWDATTGGYVWWQASLTHWLTKWQADLRCLYWGGYIWLKCIWPQVYLTNVITHMATRCLCMEGWSGWHFVC